MKHKEIRHGFLFLADDPFLDFLNTCPFRNDRLEELLPDFAALLRWFSAAGLLRPDRAAEFLSQWGTAPEGEAILRQALDFREEFRAHVSKLEASGSVPDDLTSALNAWLSRYPVAVQVVKRPGGFATRPSSAPEQLQDLLGILARLVADLVSRKEADRVRKCNSCILHFYDRTKSNTRRWCSMQLCGNRAKVAAYAARHRQNV